MKSLSQLTGVLEADINSSKSVLLSQENHSCYTARNDYTEKLFEQVIVEFKTRSLMS